MPLRDQGPGLERLRASAFRIPTEKPESDGTYEWSATTLVLAEASAGGKTGLGYTYSDAGAASLIQGKLRKAVEGMPALSIPRAREALIGSVRNIGHRGVASSAYSAVDVALWDLKARLLDVPLAALLGLVRTTVPLYGSGGFTSYSIPELCEQLGGWAAQGFRWVKMKIGRNPEQDLERVRAARRAIGGAELFVDANGAYDLKRALQHAFDFAAEQVTWFEEPVSSENLAGLRLMRDRAPPPMQISAGEYNYDATDFRRMIDAGAVDVMQADATRCGGVSTFLDAGALCRAAELPLSSHTAPALHLALGCSVPQVRHLEYFHDHVRIERMAFDGVPAPRDGSLSPDLTQPGLGLTLKRADMERFAI